MKKTILGVVAALSACSNPPPYESVTINLSGGISCTERLILDSRDHSSLTFDRRTNDTTTSLGLDLGALSVPSISGQKNNDLRQRCEDLIDIAEQHAQERVTHLKLESERLRSQIEKFRARDKLDIEHMKQSLTDFGVEW